MTTFQLMLTGLSTQLITRGHRYFRSPKALIWVLSLSCLQLAAQSRTHPAPLKIGDTLISHPIAKSIGLNEKNLNEFRGKVLILDFWTTYCGACISSFPHLESLQREFKEEVQILLVNPSQDEETIKKFINRRREKFNENISLPVVYEDSLIRKVFPHKSVPHVVWLDKAGILRATTGKDVVNEKNIKSMILGHVPTMHQKLDNWALLKWNSDKPLYKDGNGGNGAELLWRSYLGSYDPNVMAQQFIQADDKQGYCVTSTNSGIQDLYRYVYSNRTDPFGNLVSIPNGYFLLQVKDSAKYQYKKNGENQYQNFYCYQLTATKATKEQLKEFMKEDLKRYFGLDARWTKLVRDCLVLSADDTTEIQSNGGERELYFTEVGLKVNNITVGELVDYLTDHTEFYLSPYPILDETGFKGKLKQMEIPLSYRGHKITSDALAKYGLNLRLEKRMVNVFVLSEAEALIK